MTGFNSILFGECWKKKVANRHIGKEKKLQYLHNKLTIGLWLLCRIG